MSVTLATLCSCRAREPVSSAAPAATERSHVKVVAPSSSALPAAASAAPPTSADSASVGVAPQTPLERFRACAKQAELTLVVKPGAQLEAASWSDLLSRLRGKKIRLGERAARAAACRKHPPAALCATSECSQKNASFLWFGDDSGSRNVALLTVPTPTGRLRAFRAGYMINFNDETCLSADTGKPVCSDGGSVYLDSQDPRVITIRSAYFGSAGRFCLDYSNSQVWIFDEANEALALLFTSTSIMPPVRVSESEVTLGGPAPSCPATLPSSAFTALPAEGRVNEWVDQ